MLRQSRPQRQRIARIWTAVTLFASVVVMLACMQVTKLEHAPASILRLEVVFEGALAPASQIKISVSITTTPSAWVEFAGHQKLTCNGVTIPQIKSSDSRNPPTHTATIPRQPPGGSYTFVYTDEGGRQTTVIVPAPQTDLVVTQPAANARTPIPKTPVPAGDVDTTASRPEFLASEPFPITYTVPFSKDTLTTAEQGRPAADDVSVYVRGTCRQGPPTQCLVGGGAGEATGSVAITDKYTPYGQGFENFTPGPGSVALRMSVNWYLPDTGFNSFRVLYEDGVSVPVTWVEA